MAHIHTRNTFFLLGALFSCLFLSPSCSAAEIFDPNEEIKSLKNIRQLTFPSMGFEKAGEAYFSPDGQNIVFQAVPKGQEQYQIYAMDLGDGVPRMVSTGKGSCTCAYFRPDGEKIIFASSHGDPHLEDQNYSPQTPGYKRENGQYRWEFTPYMNIYEADPDGSNLVALTNGPAYHAECAYSADGKRIVFASNETGSMNLYTMKSDGTDVQQVTHTTYCYNGGPFFSPDASRIIFRADKEKRHYLQIYIINSDGTNEQKVTDNQAINWAPYWYPRGDCFAYTTSLHGHAHYEVYLKSIKTGCEYRLTHNATFDGLPVFSPDGTKMMWTSKRGPDKSCQIFLADFTLPQELQ